MKVSTTIVLLISLSLLAAAQRELLSNAQVVEMLKGGLGEDLVAAKIRKSGGSYDLSVPALVELKKAGVSDMIISVMMEKADEIPLNTDRSKAAYSESGNDRKPEITSSQPANVKDAKTIAFVKSSLQPSRQALEKELLNRPEWKTFGLTIDRYKDTADLYVEIGYVSMSWITHRYVYRIYDRRTGSVLAAGETTSWGSLAENLAKHIVKDLAKILKS